MPFVGFQASHRSNRLCCAAVEPKDKIDTNNFYTSSYLKNIRKKMQSGEMVAECHNCYSDEAKGKFSLRNHYNARYKNFEAKDGPTAMDLDFSNLCNLQCIMCGPKRSSQWSKELGDKRVMTFPKDQIDQLCEISQNVKHLNIQGGEPSLMPEFEYYFQYLKENGLIGKIDIDCISNLTNINNKFYDLLNDFKSATVNASIDAYDLANNYIRFPSDFQKLDQNLLALADKSIQVNLQVTIQTLTMFNFYDFLDWITRIQERYRKKSKNLGVNITYVTEPEYLDITNAPKKLKHKMLADLQTFKSHPDSRKQEVKFTIGLRNLEKILQDSLEKGHDTQLEEYVSLLDHRRNIKITNYIPDFYEYF
jgi:MoaA/NifB/PqqE/SkfB family radical SAM enzyme